MSEPYTIDGVTFKVDSLTKEAVVQKPASVEAHQLWILNGELLTINSVTNGVAEIGEWPCRVEYLLTQSRYIFAGWYIGTSTQLKWTEALALYRWEAMKRATHALRAVENQVVGEADLFKIVLDVATRSEVRTAEAHDAYVASGRRYEARGVCR